MLLHNDEPTTEDQLGRERVGRALADAILIAKPPLVVGIYGGWGVGKTSLMQMVESALSEKDGVDTVWFDPWFHQFDSNPEIALLHKMAESATDKDEVQKLLVVIGATLSAVALKALSGLKLSEIKDLGEQYEQEMFQVRERRARLQEKFNELITCITSGGKKKLVIFIDDLDRCTPTTVLKLLDALKLYLSHPGCVYVVGVDRDVVEQSIRTGLPGMDGYEGQYLDKLVQLPFSVPPLRRTELRGYVGAMLPESLGELAQMFSEGLDGNPRSIKRFLNTFILSHELAKTLEGVEIDKEVLGLVLLLQHCARETYAGLVSGDKDLQELLSTDVRKPETIDRICGSNPALAQVLSKFKKITEIEWEPYFFLSRSGMIADPLVEVWIKRVGFKTNEVVRKLRQLTGLSQPDAKELLEKEPCLVGHGMERADGERMADKLRAVGATVEIRDASKVARE